MKRIKVWLGIAVLAGAGTALAAGKEEKKMKEHAAACEDLSKFEQSVAALDRAGPQTTVKELKQMGENVSKDFKDAVKSAEKIAKPQVENVRKSVDQLRTDARNIPEDATLAQARSQIQRDVQQIRMASDQLLTRLNCGMGGAGEHMEPHQGQQPENP